MSMIVTTPYFTVAIDYEGNLWDWAWYRRENAAFLPSRVNTGSNRFTYITVGWSHFVAIDTFGNLWSWGDNRYNQLGLETDELFTTNPAMIETGGASFVNVSAGTAHSVAIDTAGNLWSRGSNLHGRTGLGTETGVQLHPTIIHLGNARFRNVESSRATSIAIDTESRVWSWGFNDRGITGQGTPSGGTLIPTQINFSI